MMCAGARRVDVVDHRGERRALAAAGGAGDEHQAALFLRDLLQHRRQAELVDRLDPGRDDAQHQADGAALLEDVAAEAAEPVDAVGEVDVLVLLELLDVLRAEDRLRHRLGVRAIEPLFLGRDDERAVDPHHRVAADLQVQVRRAAGHGDLQQVVDVHESQCAWPCTATVGVFIRLARLPVAAVVPAGCAAARPGRRTSASRGVSGTSPLMTSKKARLHRFGDRAAAAVADRDLVHRADRRDLDRRADEERLVGDVEHLARQHLFAHA